MTRSLAWVAIAALITTASGHAAPASTGGQADYTADDVVKGYQKPAPSPDPDPKKADACNPDEDGVCQPKKDSRGFSLTGPATPIGHAASTTPSTFYSAPRRAVVVPRQQVATLSHRGATVAAPMAPISHDLLITFKVGSSELTEKGRANARVFAQALSRPELASATFEINGHTDATGSPDKNRVLSQQRADAVRQFMVAQGADGSRLKSVGLGSDQPADPRNPEAAVNRRVEAKRLN